MIVMNDNINSSNRREGTGRDINTVPTPNYSEVSGGAGATPHKRIIVLEIGRPIVDDVKAQLGEPYAVISYTRPIIESEYPTILKEAYKKIREASQGGNEVILVLSGTLALAFQLGQLIGLSHFKIQVYQFSMGRYRPVPPITREVMF